MIIEQAIREELLLNDALTALVSKRIYYVNAPQDVKVPYIIIIKVSGPRVQSHDGMSHLVNARVQVSIFGSTYKDCKQIAQQVQSSLAAFSGVMGGGMEVGNILYINETDFYETNTLLYHVAQDYMIWHKE